MALRFKAARAGSGGKSTGMQRPGKKLKSGFQKGASADNPDRRRDKGQTHLRSRATATRIKMYKQTARRDKKGNILAMQYGMETQAGGKAIGDVARIQPDRRWFGNTRVVGQRELDEFRSELAAHVADPYSVVLKRKKLPMGLLSDPSTTARMNLLSAESYESTFGAKSRRKRPKLSSGVGSLAQMAAKAAAKAATYEEEGAAKDVDAARALAATTAQDNQGVVRERIMFAGQSKRIWGELYKVLDCSDVVIQVLDVRDPMGTRSKRVEEFLKKEAKHKHLILVLNKCDLVPSWAVRRWVQILGKEYPTIAFHASMQNPFGKGSLLTLLRQFSVLHKEKQQISVGIVGYPNTGKSSLINSMRGKKVCNVAPVPGETKTWQYVKLMGRLFLIDCPGVVYPSDDSDTSIVLKSVVRAEKIEDPEQCVS